MLLQSLVAEAVVTFSVSRLSIADLMRRGVVPATMAVVLAAPFWLPQFLWQGYILGPRGLPLLFAESF